MADTKISQLPIASILSGDPIPFVKISTSITSAIDFADFKATILQSPSIVGGAEFSTNITARSIIGVNSKTGGGIGYITGAGSIVAQTNVPLGKAQSVICHAPTGRITLASTLMASSTMVTFTLTNSVMTATDLIIVNHVSGGTIGRYMWQVAPYGGGANIVTINLRNTPATEAPVIQFAVIKGTNT